MRRKLAAAGLVLGIMIGGCGQSPDPLETDESTAPPTPIIGLTAVPTAAKGTPPLTPPPTPIPSEETAQYEAQRRAMVATGVIGWGINDEPVLQAMRSVPRHEFVPAEFLSQAYENHPLPIGHGQTISQPYIVALMTQEAEITPDDVVLEIGTGSSYQAAILAELVEHVYSIEIIGALAQRGQALLSRLGYDNVTVRHADGYFGWEEHAPFDAIVVTAAPDHVPQPLIQQLKIGGHLIIPVGPVGGIQTLWRITRLSIDEVRTENLGDVRFVPLTREDADQ